MANAAMTAPEDVTEYTEAMVADLNRFRHAQDAVVKEIIALGAEVGVFPLESDAMTADESKDMLESLEQALKGQMQAHARVQHMTASLGEISRAARGAHGGIDFAGQVEACVQDSLTYMPDVTRDPYKTWMTSWRVDALNELPDAGDDDIEVLQSALSTKDPITMTTYVNPVKGKCGHVFSKAAIVDLIRKSRGTVKCPQAGCNQRITEPDLMPDRRIEALIRGEARRARHK